MKELSDAYDELAQRSAPPYDGIAGTLPRGIPKEWHERFHQARNKAWDYYGHDDSLYLLTQYMQDIEALSQPECEFLYMTFIPSEVRAEIEVLALVKRAVSAYNAAKTKKKLAALRILLGDDTLQEAAKQDRALRRTKTPAEFPVKVDRWEDITATLIDNENIEFKAKGVTKIYSYTEAGFENSRTKRPDEGWAALCAFAYNDGEITWTDRVHMKDRHGLKERVRDIEARFRRIFGLNISPFHHYRFRTTEKPRDSYKIKIQLMDGRPWEARPFGGFKPEFMPIEDIEDIREDLNREVEYVDDKLENLDDEYD